MNFSRVLKEVLWCLVAEGRISYRRIKLSFGLDDDALEALRRELIGIKQVAADIDGEFLVWAPAGRPAQAEPVPVLRQPERPLRLSQPRRATVADRDLPGVERRHLTVMFCDLADSTRLSAQIDPCGSASRSRSPMGCCSSPPTKPRSSPAPNSWSTAAISPNNASMPSGEPSYGFSRCPVRNP